MSSPRRDVRGFTLLEVMCAFAILAMVSGFMVILWTTSLDKASNAIDRRELREVADTFFGRVLFEDSEHKDGDSGTMNIAYGQWANLPQAVSDRYEIYRYVLEKRLVTAAGAASKDSEAEPLFDSGTEQDRGRGTSSSSSSGSSSSGSTEAAAEGEGGGVNLWRVTLKIFRTDTPDGENNPLITLQTYRRPTESAKARAR